MELIKKWKKDLLFLLLDKVKNLIAEYLKLKKLRKFFPVIDFS